MTQQDNPFASPLADVGGATAEGVQLAEARQIRQTHLKYEASVKSIGTLYLVVFVISLIFGIGVVVWVVNTWLQSDASQAQLVIPLAITLAFSLPAFGIAAISLFVAWGLRQIDSRARVLTCLCSGLGMFSFPVGTALGVYVLYVLSSQKGRAVFTKRYHDVIRQTPEMRY